MNIPRLMTAIIWGKPIGGKIVVSKKALTPKQLEEIKEKPILLNNEENKHGRFRNREV